MERPTLPNRSTAAAAGGWSSGTILRNKDAKQVLLGLGFSEGRAEKALAATGGRSVQEAADWLLQHVYDPTLDSSSTREYVVYACPGGELGSQLEDFYDMSLLQCGWNSSHKSFPHVTLCQFFRCEDHMMPHVVHALQLSYDAHGPTVPPMISTQRFLSQGYIGLFVEEDGSQWMRELMNSFSLQVKKQGIILDAHKKQLHITLAHQYRPDHQTLLETLCRKINPVAPNNWELRLYSRDVRLATAEVCRVVYKFAPSGDDELQLENGDYVFVPNNQVAESEGWMRGVSMQTGLSGMFPSNYVERTRESDCWALHRSWKISREVGNRDSSTASLPISSFPLPRKHSSDPMHQEPMYDNANGLLPTATDKEDLYAKVNMAAKKSRRPSTADPRSLFIFRHAERVDVTFGKQWIDLSFDSNGLYNRKNLNMPQVIPYRQGGRHSFVGDTPITEMGLYQATLTGQGLMEQGITFTHVFSSPSLRCLQTCQAILQGMGGEHTTTPSINVEQGLFEWLAWCRGNVPQFMTLQELEQFGINVNHDYETKVSVKDLKLKESCTEYYKRSHNITRIILKMASQQAGAKVLVVGHAGTLEACTRQLVGGAPRSVPELTKIVQQVPYCGLCVCEEVEQHQAWSIVDPPVPPLTHAPNVRFDWRIFT